MKLAECVLGNNEGEYAKCKIMTKCPIADPVHRVHRKIRDFLSELTLADVLLPTRENTFVKTVE